LRGCSETRTVGVQSTLANTLLEDEDCAHDNHVLACNFAKYLPIKKFTDRLGNKSLLIWLLTTPPHLQYVATLPCFPVIIVLQDSVAT